MFRCASLFQYGNHLTLGLAEITVYAAGFTSFLATVLPSRLLSGDYRIGTGPAKPDRGGRRRVGRLPPRRLDHPLGGLPEPECVRGYLSAPAYGRTEMSRRLERSIQFGTAGIRTGGAAAWQARERLAPLREGMAADRFGAGVDGSSSASSKRTNR